MLCLAVPDDNDEGSLDEGDAAVILLCLDRGIVALYNRHKVLVGRRVTATSATPAKSNLGSCTQGNHEDEDKGGREKGRGSRETMKGE